MAMLDHETRGLITDFLTVRDPDGNASEDCLRAYLGRLGLVFNLEDYKNRPVDIKAERERIDTEREEILAVYLEKRDDLAYTMAGCDSEKYQYIDEIRQSLVELKE